MQIAELQLNRARTKIVATVGPACPGAPAIQDLIRAGVDVFRINTAHGDRNEHIHFVTSIREAADKIGWPIAILIDLGGPKIRLGQLFEEPTHCLQDAEFTFVRGMKSSQRDQLVSYYERLIDELDVGDDVMLADGTVSMQVIEKQEDAARCRVIGPGIIRSRQGINLPGIHLSTPAMTGADIANAIWAAENEIDFVGLSFVRTPKDVLNLKELLRKHGSLASVIAKIEKREALDELEAIVDAADGIMVARGDLGVEIDIAETPIAQKRIIEVCRQRQKPVIVATQMLDSMQHSRLPTRAEATDVANAVLDGADACMLSGETSIGKHPLAAVEMMNRIMTVTETMLDQGPSRQASSPLAADVHPITSAVVYGAARIAERLKARLVVVASRSGATARIKAKQHDLIPTVGVSEVKGTLRQMCLLWGVIPVAGAPVGEGPKLWSFIDRWGKRNGCLEKGDPVVFVTGTGVVDRAHNQLIVHRVE